MADLPISSENTASSKSTSAKEQIIEVTDANADKLVVHFLAQIHARLGYIVKLLETDKKKKGIR